MCMVRFLPPAVCFSHTLRVPLQVSATIVPQQIKHLIVTDALSMIDWLLKLHIQFCSRIQAMHTFHF
jgi:hypothetical protein